MYGNVSRQRNDVQVHACSSGMLSGQQRGTQTELPSGCRTDTSADCTRSDTAIHRETRNETSVLSRIRQALSFRRVSKSRKNVDDQKSPTIEQLRDTQAEPHCSRSLGTSASAIESITREKMCFVEEKNTTVAKEKYTAETQQPGSTCSGPTTLPCGVRPTTTLTSLQYSPGHATPKKAFRRLGSSPTALEAERWRLLGDTSERLRKRKISLRNTLRESLAVKKALF